MSNDWLKIRHWNGSQNLAFEELCCQLAQFVSVPAGSRFTRKGAPDAGVECFWKLPNGDEWGWQAKFFVASLSDGEWAQLDKSVTTALEKHPRLTKYTICVPMNFPDARLPNQKSGLDKWHDHVNKWVGWAKGKEIQIDFDCWNESSILSRLSKEEHRGRRFFWFNEEVFSAEWFRNQIDAAKSNAGPRYTPELNVDLPIARNFDGLGRTVEFYDRYRKLYGELRRQDTRCYPSPMPEPLTKFFQEMEQCIGQLLIKLAEIKEPTSELIPFEVFTSQIAACGDKAYECRDAVDEYVKSEASRGQSPASGNAGSSFEYRKGLREYSHDIGELLAILRRLRGLSESKEAQAANLSALLVVGDAGIGKTHLLCDVAEKRMTNNRPSILFLGEQFTDEEPWSQMIKLIGLNCNREEFLGALEAGGAAFGCRIVILIDALNEGEGTRLWHKHLAGIVTTLSRYKEIALAITVRSSYETSVVPIGIVPSTLIRVVHEGFSDNEYRAMQTFFNYFGIEHPSVPLLAPEFQNPLFLKIFCLALRNLKLTKIPSGLTGITQLLSFFLDSINSRLSRSDCLDFDVKDRPVHVAVDNLAQLMAAKGATHLGYVEARDAVNAVLRREGFERSLFRNLISEGLLAQERIPLNSANGYEEVIHFAYERFTDHLIAKYFLDRNVDVANVEQAFAAESNLGKLFSDEFGCWRNKGVLEALCVQVPERFGREVPELLNHCASFEAMRFAFVESLIWRNPRAITEKTLMYVNTEVIRHEDSRTEFLNALLTVATYPEHPYNSRFLHRHLFRYSMPDRDAWWSIFLHGQYGEGGAIDRLVDWAWFSENKSQVTDDSVLLASIALAWFLTSSNRYLRDRATKALVSLLTPRIEVLQKMLLKFRGVNDPYVAERLYGVAYGCALRTTDTKSVALLAQYVYDAFFSDGRPVPHILLRDYARGVIEVALRNGGNLKIDATRVRPPYKTTWPSRIPSGKYLKEKFGTWYKGMPEDEWASITIFRSVMDGDFGRYIIGTNFGRHEFSSRRLGEPKRPNYKQRYDSFVRSLTKTQKDSFEAFEKSFHLSLLAAVVERDSGESGKRGASSPRIKRTHANPSISALRATLGKRKSKRLDADILPYLKNPASERQRDFFDLRVAQRWILKRVLDLGWTSKKFGRFDRNVELYGNRGREDHKAERIGKKYQWIAYHEFLSHLLDNFQFNGDSWGETIEKYDGAWQLYVRDVDPSVVVPKTRAQRSQTWWAPLSFGDWNKDVDDKSWIADSTDLPDPKPLLVVVDPKDGSRWITLEAWFRWEQSTPAEEERFEYERREVWHLVRCYLARRKDIEKLFEWAKKQDFMGRWMPENRESSRVFLGEFSWAPAFLFHDQPYYSREGWTEGSQKVVPAPVLACADGYLGESSTRDCSVTDTINIMIPVKFIMQRMGLRWRGSEGEFANAAGNVVAFDPSVKNPGPSALLISVEAFEDFLRNEDCELFWMLLGEKQMVGGHMSSTNWKGRLEMSGAFCRSRNGVEGIVNTKYVSPK